MKQNIQSNEHELNCFVRPILKRYLDIFVAAFLHHFDYTDKGLHLSKILFPRSRFERDYSAKTLKVKTSLTLGFFSSSDYLGSYFFRNDYILRRL